MPWRKINLAKMRSQSNWTWQNGMTCKAKGALCIKREQASPEEAQLCSGHEHLILLPWITA